MLMLQELTINNSLSFRRIVLPFNQFESLQNLKLNLRPYDFIVSPLRKPLLTNNVSIEELRFTKYMDTNSIDNICQLKSLKILGVEFWDTTPKQFTFNF